jgi:hypothetical protein
MVVMEFRSIQSNALENKFTFVTSTSTYYPNRLYSFFHVSLVTLLC